MVPFIPIAIALDAANAEALIVFSASVLGVVPTAALMGKATDELAHRSGPGIGGLLNVTFGNAPELIIALFALPDGLQGGVKASLVGSILGNLLLVMGFSMLVGGWRRDKQTFVGAVASSQSTMLLLACVALVLPATFQLSLGGGLPSPEEDLHRYSHDLEAMSALVSGVLLLSYAAGLFFSLKTHKDIFNPDMEAGDDEEHEGWSVRRCVMWLAVAGIGVGFMSEILVGSIEEASHSIGLSPFFVSLI